MKWTFLQYVTIFRSRLGLLNLVIKLCEGSQMPKPTLERRLQRELFRELSITSDDPHWNDVIWYLVSKGYIGKKPKAKGFFKGISYKGKEYPRLLGQDGEIHELKIRQIDYWLSFSDVPSTIGAPTTENISELIDFAISVRLINKNIRPIRVGSYLKQYIQSYAADNPFLIGHISTVYFKILIEVDGPMLLSFVQEIELFGSEFSRSDVVARFPQIVRRAQAEIQERDGSPESRKAIKDFVRLVDSTTEQYRKKGLSNANAPGVLEHRVTPRLEWLVDLGFLHKYEDSKNAFSYRKGERFSVLAKCCKNFEPDVQFLLPLSVNEAWTREPPGFRDIVNTYRLLASNLGAVEIDELAFFACVMRQSQAYRETVSSILSMADNPAVRFQGGRYSRNAQYVSINLKKLASSKGL